MSSLSVTYTLTGGSPVTIDIAASATPAETRDQIQFALDQAAANPTGGTVTLSSGTFLLAGTSTSGLPGVLRAGSNTVFQGAGDQGDTSTVLKLDGPLTGDVTGIVRTDSGQTNPDGTIASTHDVVIRGMVIDGAKADNGTARDVDGFYCGPNPNTAEDHDSNITLQNVTIQNCSRYGFDPHALTTNLTFQSCTATNNKDGFTIDGCGADGTGNGVSIVDCVATGNVRHGFNVTTGSSNVVISSFTAVNNGQSGIVVQTGNNEIRDWTDNITISGGTVGGNGANGIRVTQSEQIKIENVNFQGQVATPLIELAGVRPDPYAALSFGAEIIGCTVNGTAGLTLGNQLSVKNYLQTFGTAAVEDDRWIVTSGVSFGQSAATTPVIPTGINTTGAVLWDYILSDHRGNINDIVNGTVVADSIAAGRGDDVISGNAGNDKLYGEDGNDQLFGDSGDDQLYGGAGTDLLNGGDGDDTLYGGRADDALEGGAGNDVLNGGYGIDTASYASAAAGVEVSLLISQQQDTKGAGLDTLAMIENVTGSAFADKLTGDANANLIKGGDGNDVLASGGGLDKICGGDGNDTLNGGDGADTIAGGNGLDRMTGGTGSDRFDFDTLAQSVSGTGRDVIYDFEGAGVATGDRIDLSTLDAIASLTGNQNFTWMGTGAFTGAGQVRYAMTGGGNTIIYVNTDTDAASEFEITLMGRHALYAADFVL